MMKFASLKLTAAVFTVSLVSGCSLFGDTFDDRAENYLTTEELPVIQLADDSPELAFRDANVIPELPLEPQQPESFETPRPLVFVAQVNDETVVTSLAQFRSEALNPRLDKDGAGTEILRLDLGFAASWAAVTEAIAASDLKLTDLNRSTGTYYLELNKTEVVDERSWWDKLWGEELVTTATYLLKMNRSRQGVYLSLLTDADNLAEAEQTSRVLAEIETQLTQ
ncbi:outer membrane protein assembly factor BamC [Bacterioplanoides sp.]|uniref:outer membrane protein assembly factor BamC n=1 Tax=Bacterioplanoides sp. TaxID=2066072 RepID=UPI003B59720B